MKISDNEAREVKRKNLHKNVGHDFYFARAQCPCPWKKKNVFTVSLLIERKEWIVNNKT